MEKREPTLVAAVKALRERKEVAERLRKLANEASDVAARMHMLAEKLWSNDDVL